MTQADDLEYLKERVRYLEEILGVRHPAKGIPREWGLSLRQTRMLAVLLRREECSAAELTEAMWYGDDEPADPVNNVRVYITRARRKLANHGISVCARRGRVGGYWIEPKLRSEIRKQLGL